MQLGDARGVWHPVDLPEGYHTAPRAQGWHDRLRLVGRLRPSRRAVGLRQVDGMPHGSQRGDMLRWFDVQLACN
ncbi:hypothetical protein GCM10009609_36220 [Pseudonocardia aurantiaca]